MSPAQHNGPVESPANPGAFRQLLPIVGAIFVGFLMVGLPLAVIPLHVHDALGFGPVAVGALVSAQFAASLLSRPWAGILSDSRGPKVAVTTGFGAATLAGTLYLVSLALLARPAASLGILFAARLALGCAESMVATGSLAWGIGRLGPRHAGIVMVWVGNAIFAAWALGAPAGALFYRHFGFAAVAIAASVVPLAALAALWRVAGHRGSGAVRTPFAAVLARVALPGAGLALTSIGFGAITAFIALYFAARGWNGAPLAFTAFGVAFIGARLAFGSLPDKIGGARVALGAVIVAACGLALVGLAISPAMAYVGAAAVGAGYSLAFPAFGVEAVRRAPGEARGAAMGAYVMFLDVGLAITGPLAGFAVATGGYAAMYLIAAAVMLSAAVVAARLLRHDVGRLAA
jgi:MFS family permease